jgi:type IV pilus assembly protein PilA
MKSMKMMKKAQSGFTLIELMIVVAIIGILAAVAIPQYQNYVIRAKLSKVATAVDPIKLAVAEYAQTNGGVASVTAAGGWTSLGLTATGPTLTTEISAYTIADNGVISATLRDIKATVIDGQTITWAPGDGVTGITWTVTSSSSDPALVSTIGKWK